VAAGNAEGQIVGLASGVDKKHYALLAERGRKGSYQLAGISHTRGVHVTSIGVDSLELGQGHPGQAGVAVPNVGYVVHTVEDRCAGTIVVVVIQISALAT
jgi:hypothetical protein